MIQKFEEFCLNEEKQVGIIYHYTSLWSLLDILKDNFLIAKTDVFNSVPEGFKHISFTRDKNFHKSPTRDSDGIGGTSVRIVIDGDKLSNKYKIEPYNYFGDKKELGDWAESKGKLKDRFEAEERIYIGKIQKISDINKYVISYEILRDKFNEFTLTDWVKNEMKKCLKVNPKVKVIDSKGKDVKLNEEIDASEAYSEEGSLQTVLDRKRSIALVFLNDKKLQKILKENPELDYIKVFENPIIKEKYINSFSNSIQKLSAKEYANESTILFWNDKDGNFKAKKLLDIMHTRDGFVFGDTPRQEAVIGKLLGYSNDSIRKFINKKFYKST